MPTKKQHALINGSLFSFNKAIGHPVDPGRSIVLCSNSDGDYFVTQQEWCEAVAAFDVKADAEGIVTSSSSNKQKLELFRLLFLGREDVYAHGYRKRDGGIGYSPACRNEWAQGICPRTIGQPIKCAECAHRSFKQLDDATIIRHFKGQDERFRDVIGQYVLNKNCETHILVMDFDKQDWKSAVSAIRSTARNHGICSALERSRSGNGGHIWFFFDKPIKAQLARTFGGALIAEVAAANKAISFDAYDRMLPAQSTIPEGGFGNLVALPFQGRAQRNGNSVFIDDNFEPYPDQWLYLSQIKMISEQQVQDYISVTASQAHSATGAMGAQQKEPQLPWTHQKALPLCPRDFPPKLIVTESDMLYIPEKALSASAQAAIKRLAAFANPDFFRAQAMHQSVYGKPRIVYFGETRGEHVALPRGCREKVRQVAEKAGVPLNFIDKRTDGVPISVSFNGSLRPEQQEAADALLRNDNGILSAPTGFGKTVVAAYIASQLQVSTLIIVPKTVLITQWKSQLERFLTIVDTRKPKLTPKGKASKIQPPLIGQIGGGKTKPGGIIDIATFQSLTSKDPETGTPQASELLNRYGLVICDECHHAAAAQLQLILNSTPAKHVYGLSATPKRSDGLTKALFMLCGPIRYTVDPKAQAVSQGIKRILRPRFTNYPLLSENANATYNEILNWLCDCRQRNELIVQDVADTLERGQWPLVLTKRKKHAALLCELLESKGCTVKLLVGGGPAKEQKKALAELAVDDVERYVIVATESFLGEGFDLSRLDALFLATPISWDGNVTQQAGRLHRTHEGKTEVDLFDYVDLGIPMLSRMYKKRLKTYARLGYEARVGSGIAPEDSSAIVAAKDAMERLIADISNAKRSITIAVPYASEKAALLLKPHLEDALARGVKVGINLPPAASELARNAAAILGISPTASNTTRQSFAIFDNQLVWFGTLPLLAFPKQDDCSIRFRDADVARELGASVVPEQMQPHDKIIIESQTHPNATRAIPLM